jgi:diguanylate cyclase (GGDEF)-like protein
MDDTFNSLESLRLQALKSYVVLDTPAEQAYDDIVSLAALICGVPMALISLVDEDRQWFKAKVGVDVMETPRGQAFCAHAILEPEQIMEVHDASLDRRFATNPLVTGDPNIRFYAGAPLLTPSGSALGTVCVLDRVPRTLTPAMAEALKALSRQVSELLALRRANAELRLLAQAQTARQKQLESYQKRLEELNQQLSRQTQTDSLTDLLNRRAFDRVLEEEHARFQRSHLPMALVMVDVDHFKAFNDDFGHVAGDGILHTLAQTLRAEARNYDHVARYGGEEFAVILPNTACAEAMVVAERIRRAIETTECPHRNLTASLGVAFATKSDSPASLVERADKALYQAKRQGRNGVVALDDGPGGDNPHHVS